MTVQALEMKKQSGAVLIVGLIMVLLMTVIGLAAIRGSGLQEKMAGNMRDRNLAFQASESALREAENTLTGAEPDFTGALVGYYKFDDAAVKATGRAHWQQYWENGGVSAQYSNDIDGVKARPSYVVERIETLEPGMSGGAIDWASMLETDPEISYRITSRAVGGTTDAVVILQSTFK